MENYFKKINISCIACGKRSFIFFANKNNFNLYQCKNCGLIFVWPTPKNIDNIYSKDYFSGAKNGFGYVDYDKDKQAMAATFKIYLDKIKEFSANGRNLLDVGTATGYFLELAKQKNWNAMGFEISHFAAEKARAKGLNVVTGKMESINVPEGYFDVITFWDVIEHFSDPKIQLLLARKILKEGGLVAINTPDAGSFAAKLLGRHWHLLVPPEHLIIFNQKNLSILLKSCGFEVLWIGKVGKKFTIQYVLQILTNKIHSNIFKKAAEVFKDNYIGKITIPINLRDNFSIIAKKI